MWFAETVTDEGRAAMAAFHARLDKLHAAAGRPTLRQLSKHARLEARTLPTSTAHNLLGATGTPRWVTVEAFIIACLAHARAQKPPLNIPSELADISQWLLLRDRIKDAYGSKAGAEPDRQAKGSAQRAAVPPAQLPGDVPAFTGRREHLARLDLLDNTHRGKATAGAAAPARIVVISGMAGVGKTALAVHWAHQAAVNFPGGLLHVNLRGFGKDGSIKSAAEAVRGFLDALEVPAAKVPADFDAQVALYRSHLAGRRMLIIVDDARDAEHVRPLLPGSADTMMIITSRDQLASLIAIEGAHLIGLDLLSADEARVFISRRVGAARVDAEPEAVEEIIAFCSGLPLAMVIVIGRALTRPTFALADIASELHHAHQRLDHLTGPDLATDIRAVFSMSYNNLKPETAHLFRLLGLHPGPDISESGAASLAAISPQQGRATMTELASAHLITEIRPGRYTMHDLLHLFAAELGHTHDTEKQRQAATGRLLDHYLHTGLAAERILSPHRDHINVNSPSRDSIVEDFTSPEQAMAWLTAERQVLLATIDLAGSTGFDTHTWQIAWILAPFLDRRGYWQDQIATGPAALAASQRQADPLAQTCVHRILGFAYLRLGDNDNADMHLRQALGLSSEIGDQVGQAHTHGYLSMLLEQQGDLAGALGHDLQALGLYQAAEHQHGFGQALNAVGWGYALLSDYPVAIDYCTRALNLHQELGDRHGQAATWDSLGYAHHHLGDHNQAITCYQHALRIIEDLGDRYWEAEALDHLGDTCCRALKMRM